MSESATLFRSGYIVERRQDYVWFLGLPIVALVFAFVSGQYLPGAALAASERRARDAAHSPSASSAVVAPPHTRPTPPACTVMCDPPEAEACGADRLFSNLSRFDISLTRFIDNSVFFRRFLTNVNT